MCHIKDGLILFFDLEAITDISGKVSNMQLVEYIISMMYIPTDYILTFFSWHPQKMGLESVGREPHDTVDSWHLRPYVISSWWWHPQGVLLYFVLQMGKVKRIDSS